MSIGLQGEKQTISEEQLVSQLVKSPLLPQFIRELILEEAIAPITYLPAELDEIRLQLSQSPQGEKLSPQHLEALAVQKVKVEKFKRLHWRDQIQTYFINHKAQWDQVIYSVIRTDSAQTTQEIYFRLNNGEESFAELAQQYSQGTEAHNQGRIGPIELGLIHPNIAQVLRGSKVGEISPLVQINQWCAIFQLEQFIPAQLDANICQQILDQQFEAWLQGKVYQEVKRLESLAYQQKQQAKVPIVGRIENSQLASLIQPTPYPLRAQEEFVTTCKGQEDLYPPLHQELASNSSIPIESWKDDLETTKTQEKLYQKLRALLRKHSKSTVLTSLMILIVPLGFGGLSLPFFNPSKPQPPQFTVTSGQDEFRQGVNHALKAVDLLQSAQSKADWTQVVNHWQEAIALMNQVPSTYSKSTIAQEKVMEYQRYLNYAQQQVNRLSDPFREGVNHANEANRLLPLAQSHHEWNQISQEWKQAIALMTIVPPESPHYQVAQRKVLEYQRYLQYSHQQATQKIQQSHGNNL